MKILVIGGTKFIGRHFVEAALQVGHEITLLHRGKTNAELFPETLQVIADRDGGMNALPDESWDCVLDTCGYVPRVVKQSCGHLKKRVGQYCFISTGSVYADFKTAPLTEDSALAKPPAANVEEITGETYGGLKVACENEVLATFPKTAFIPRPGIIAGPYDPSDRFTYWACRMQRGGRALVPGRPEQPVQLIDARDFMRWVLSMMERGESGIYNAVAPTTTSTELLTTLGDAEQVYVSGSALESLGCPPNSIHAWYTGDDVDEEPFAWKSIADKAVSKGLTFRPIEDTASDVRSWASTRPDNYEWRIGLTTEREQELLQALAT
jgi:2'-hydroxyisoflavone reductase